VTVVAPNPVRVSAAAVDEPARETPHHFLGDACAVIIKNTDCPRCKAGGCRRGFLARPESTGPDALPSTQHPPSIRSRSYHPALQRTRRRSRCTAPCSISCSCCCELRSAMARRCRAKTPSSWIQRLPSGDRSIRGSSIELSSRPDTDLLRRTTSRPPGGTVRSVLPVSASATAAILWVLPLPSSAWLCPATAGTCGRCTGCAVWSARLRPAASVPPGLLRAVTRVWSVGPGTG
jgi:hypothetical protein